MNKIKIPFFIIALSIFLFFSVPLFAVDKGDVAPAFVLTDLNNNYIFSKNIYGKNWVLVDFYATWCVNCNKELPHIEDLYNDYKDMGLDVYLLAADKEGRDILLPHFSKSPTVLTVLVDKYQKAVEAFGVSELPAVFLVNKEGKIAYKMTGFNEDEMNSLRSFLSEALNE
ncbi:MAG: TlpA disulfide reductase family protein [Spirochaetales bacterium]|nr:TlpA disulfide reductase family protein [Spirochaetales bacterium]